VHIFSKDPNYENNLPHLIFKGQWRKHYRSAKPSAQTDRL